MPHPTRAARRATAVAGLLATCALTLPAAAFAGPTGEIEGEVTAAANHSAIENAHVCVEPRSGGSPTCVYTNSSGEYFIPGLAAGEYELEITHAGYARFSDILSVTAGHKTEQNARLTSFGAITGSVSAGGAPLAHVEVCAFEVGDGYNYRCTTTGPNGEYELGELLPASYEVDFHPPETCAGLNCSTPYVFEYWNGKLNYEFANPVVVAEGATVAGIDPVLSLGGHITGKVTNAANGQPIAGAYVCSYLEGLEEQEGPCQFANAAGEYTLSGLATGSYELQFTGEVCVETGGHRTCTRPWVGQYDQAAVAVTAPNTTAGINAALVARLHEKPVSTSAPTVTGTPTVGSVITCTPGGWGNNPTAFAYQWLRNGTAISGQTGTTYTVVTADEGTSLTCAVTATDAAGATAATSNALAVAKPTPGVAGVVGVSAKGATASVKLHCTGESACKGKLELTTRETVRGHGKHAKAKVKTVVIGTADFSLAVGASDTVHVHLGSSAQKLIHAASKKGLAVEITGTSVTKHTANLK
jgi:hypothetical protein